MEAEIRRLLGETAAVGTRICCFSEVDSTNTRAKEMALEGAPHGTVVLADCQRAGRGRLGRTFQSPKGKGIYGSVLLRPDLPAERLAPVTALAGVAACRAVERICGICPALKWPNDLVLNGNKLCGILTELVTDAGGSLCLIVGVGINVAQCAEDFTPEVAEVAASLEMLLERAVSRPALTAALLEELDRVYQKLEAGALEEELAFYREHCLNIGRTVRLKGTAGTQDALAVDVDGTFGLVVRLTDGTEKTVRSGEVSVRGLGGYAE